ncbi:MAG TPA: 4a-hydroxytetrahydrobiopterin dehydratase [Oculatellaceae cyanobacterium]
MALAEKKCVPCSGSTPALKGDEIAPLIEQLDADWKVQGTKLQRAFKFDNFLKPMRLAKAFADIAEQQQHHPDLTIRWGELVVEIWTHAINGLSEADFVLAAKYDKCLREYGATL